MPAFFATVFSGLIIIITVRAVAIVLNIAKSKGEVSRSNWRLGIVCVVSVGVAIFVLLPFVYDRLFSYFS
ncbi:hypothetical protein JCM19037_397 [Geomicrobium sp. JCM 19037]|uniref:hypothetical protein n=1 Tax=Geomicrobium sp. JCM 19037 TaxID=1460634 RepID=UPI00045F3FEB|nr:hypothetical protein [Geomicrobium sp. JCM 19037]GAK02180.1 hypothetical protein JCM19037_397 [Geomicrobium sp. JCM 19037]